MSVDLKNLIPDREIDEYYRLREELNRNGLYRIEDERDSCGVGFVAAIDGKPRKEILELGVKALQSVWHRGATDADGKSGDGAGVRFQISREFFTHYLKSCGASPVNERLAVGQIFLPRRNIAAQDKARMITEREIVRSGYYVCAWRQVPVDTSVLGQRAEASRPEIEQVIVAGKKDETPEAFELQLFYIRRRIEKAILAEAIQDFYICSFSCRSIIYKGMFLAQHIADFFPDLKHPLFTCSYVIFHQRYSTNTYPEWRLAHPYRTLAHNGEINTLKGNVNRMKCHEILLAEKSFPGHADEILPLIAANGSDSAALDAVFEAFIRAGRTAPEVKSLLIPEAFQHHPFMSEKRKAMNAYAHSVIEPWDGPASIVASDDRWLIAGTDRNGLRPFRYCVTEDGLIIAGSETGMTRIQPEAVLKRGGLGPGALIALDMQEGKLYLDDELKEKLAEERDFKTLCGGFRYLDQDPPEEKETNDESEEAFLRRQFLFAHTRETLEMLVDPAVMTGKEAVGSMGDDTPIAVLSKRYRPLSHFFRQNFSQVTNPPIDPLREKYVMSLTTRFGNLLNLKFEDKNFSEILTLESPILTDALFERVKEAAGEKLVTFDCVFPVESETEIDFHERLTALKVSVTQAVKDGARHIVLTDEKAGEAFAPLPVILAVGAAHAALTEAGLRNLTALHVRSGECADAHYAAVLIGVGATTVNPYMAQAIITERVKKGRYSGLNVTQAVRNFKESLDSGLLKIISKCGISVISSYRGGCNFDIVGLSRTLTADYFPGASSRVSGIGLNGLKKKILTLREAAYDPNTFTLPVGGFFRYREREERHALDAALIHALQTAVNENSQVLFRKYSEKTRALALETPVAFRDLLDFKTNEVTPISQNDVEAITEIRKCFVTPGMSLGSLSPEAHRTLTVAMNRIGAKSDSGEGGEDPECETPSLDGDNLSAAIKQVASGRFGVTARYLNACRELEIKIAQGAKPGEGGQLPGYKVTELIAKLRHSSPGVTLISPPPHHDIYSIEDLAQLIYDLKQINPTAEVCVKLVSQSGIGAVAVGAVKAGADVILISGHSGGTGASAQSSVKFAGSPWETGLAEANQALILNKMRSKVKLRTDGGLKTGRDIVTAAMLGAEEFGIGTAALVAVGCLMVRQCHSNTCPVGICTQDEALRAKYSGTPEKVINLMTLIAVEVREILASLGLRSVKEAVGRTDLLKQISRGWVHFDDLDLNPILLKPDTGGAPSYRTENPETPPGGNTNISLNQTILKDTERFLQTKAKTDLFYPVRNTNRTVGARLASQIIRKLKGEILPEDAVTLRFSGSAGQSFGAFAVRGMKLLLSGDANDYVGKGLSGGLIAIEPGSEAKFSPHENMIIGNTCLYGATSGALFANGRAGERFAVRNSGAFAVIEGAGANACEYMTGGVVIILGSVGLNFGAGMTGGRAFVYDPERKMEASANLDTVTLVRGVCEEDRDGVMTLLQRHAQLTGSLTAREMIEDFSAFDKRFVTVIPKDALILKRNHAAPGEKAA